MLQIRNDPNWRTTLGNGVWFANRSIDSGTFSLSAVDPIDNDIAQGENHPVVLTGMGKQGTAVFKTSARLEIGPRVGSCLEVSMTSGNDTTVSGATLTSDQSIAANRNFNAISGAVVNADVEAYGTLAGSTYTKATLQRTLTRQMPESGQAFAYYLANGTTISASSLPVWSQSEKIKNGTFELSLSNWSARTNCVLERSFARSKGGWCSLRVSSRTSSSDVAVQDLPTGQLTSGDTYRLVMPILPTAVGTARGVLTLESSVEGVQTFATPDFALNKDGSGNFSWMDLQGTIVPSWTGTLIKATVSVWTSTADEYYLDNVSLIDVTYPDGASVIDRRLISPSVNPFGSGNAKGIYIVNCGGRDVILGRSRIVGTLVFIDPGSNSAVQDSVSWEAAVANFPALLTNHKFTIKLGSAGLSETAIGVNLNPANTPYPYQSGVANETLTDSFPSRVTGLIYSAEDLEFSGAPAVAGVVIAQRDINVRTSSLSLNYGNLYQADPPPGFDVGSQTMKVVSGSWQRTVD